MIYGYLELYTMLVCTMLGYLKLQRYPLLLATLFKVSVNLALGCNVCAVLNITCQLYKSYFGMKIYQHTEFNVV